MGGGDVGLELRVLRRSVVFLLDMRVERVVLPNNTVHQGVALGVNSSSGLLSEDMTGKTMAGSNHRHTSVSKCRIRLL